MKGKSSSPGTAAPLSTFTAIPSGWNVPLGQLVTVDARRRMAAFRAHLYLAAALANILIDGWLFGYLHGSYDPATQTFQLHIHGVAHGGMIDVVDALHGLGKYKPAQPFDERDAATTPVRRSHKALSNMPEPLHYVMQRWWPVRETYRDTDGIRKAYGGRRRAITGPAYAEYVTFLNRCRLEDLSLMMGMHVTKEGLCAR